MKLNEDLSKDEKFSLNEVHIENFRSYRGIHKFKLDRQITILYGENGYGKSSFFDAIEWCLTGKLDRYNDKGFKLKDYIINHEAKDKNGVCSVTLFLGDQKIQRSFSVTEEELSKATVKILSKDDQIIGIGQANVDRFLRKQNGDKNDNPLFSSYLKQTNILSQDQVTDLIVRDKPEDRFEALAEIMGLKQVFNISSRLGKFVKRLEGMIKSYVNNINQYNEVINNLQSKLTDIDLFKFNERLIKLQLQDISVDELEIALRDINNQIVIKKAKLNESLMQVNNLSHKGFQSLSDIEKEITVNESKSNLLLDKIKRLKVLLERVSHKVKAHNNESAYYEQTSQKITKVEQLKKHIEMAETQLNEPFSLLLVEKNVEHVNQILMGLKEKIREINYVYTFYDDFHVSQKALSEEPKIQERLKNKVDQLNIKVNRRKQAIEKLNNWLNNNGEEVALSNLYNAINEIFSYVQITNNNGVCPVCSTEKGDELNQIILRNIDRYKELHLNQSNLIKNVSSKKSDYELKIEKIKFEIKENSNLFNKSQSRLIKGKEILSRLTGNELFNQELFNLEKYKLVEMKQDLDLEVVKLEQAKEILIKLEADKSELESLQKDLGNLDEMNLSQLKELFDKRYSKLQRRLRRIHDITDIVEGQYKAVQVLNEQLKAELSTLINQMDFLQLSDNFVQLISIINQEIEKNRKDEGFTLETINQLSELKKNSEISKDIKFYYAQKANEEKRLELAQSAIDLIQKFISEIYSSVGTQAMDFINKPSSSIQKYYRYLNPLPFTSSSVYFETTEQESVDILIPYESSTTKGEPRLSSAKYALSSAQLHVLAISIFLAINESQELTKLDFIGIDDPIQNMDDVNQFSVCDVLSDIKKQLIFSTHDIEFMKLFIKKNELKRDKIRVYVLQSPILTPDKVEMIAL